MNDAFLMNHEDNTDLEELSPLMEAIVPKLAACHIREHQPEDLEACIEVYRSNEPDFLAPEGLENFIEFLKLGTSYYLVIEHDGDVIGCGGLELVGDSDSSTLVYGMVHREYHRRGFGTTLLAARIALLEVEDRPIDLWMRTSTASMPFYGRFGFAYHADRSGRARDHASLWLSIDGQDILDTRDALEERSIRIYLNEDEGDEEES
jgi:N-acetylglutamate synthase-like GNAT family acetyltransferase